jgi:hypothetical protein
LSISYRSRFGLDRQFAIIIHLDLLTTISLPRTGPDAKARYTAPTAMAAMAAMPRPPFDRVDCEELLAFGWLVAVLDDDVADSLLVVAVLEDNVLVATKAVAVAWPS